eukprot:TRINITY_DN16608_c0_g1_i1.p1 TRINITY_DN16608_c0_g1~~TRINITY_DN16608_c0_g1_i1.p1  ORF type:complete len:189 (-),score=31.74 TRINITY_DN16608_c0_g1_i1:171-737(-)
MKVIIAACFFLVPAQALNINITRSLANGSQEHSAPAFSNTGCECSSSCGSTLLTDFPWCYAKCTGDEAQLGCLCAGADWDYCNRPNELVSEKRHHVVKSQNEELLKKNNELKDETRELEAKRALLRSDIKNLQTENERFKHDIYVAFYVTLLWTVVDVACDMCFGRSMIGLLIHGIRAKVGGRKAQEE